jgi:hypothetical protein
VTVGVLFSLTRSRERASRRQQSHIPRPTGARSARQSSGRDRHFPADSEQPPNAFELLLHVFEVSAIILNFAQEAAKIGGLEIQLVYYRGLEEFQHSGWTAHAHELANQMSRITCATGYTQIGRVLAHLRKEHTQRPVSAAIFVGDATEEKSHTLYNAAAGLGVPLFVFQEGSDPEVVKVFREMARLTKGAYSSFTPSAARELAELLRAVAAFAAGGLTALADLRTEGARRLLSQLK